jgi:F-type H+-transporting ATPase subunit epsilon
MSSILLEIVTPEGLLLSEDVYMIMAAGSEGAMGILPGHTHLLTALTINVLRWQLPGGEEKKAAVSGGFMEVTPTKVSILAESAELPEQIDETRCQDARRRALERLAQGKDGADINLLRAERALQRALNRLKALN